MYRANFHNQRQFQNRGNPFLEPFASCGAYRSVASLPLARHSIDSFHRAHTPARGTGGFINKLAELDLKEAELKKSLTEKKDLTEAERGLAMQRFSLLESARKMVSIIMEQAQKTASMISANMR